MECRNHPGTSAADRCAGCTEPFCPNCLVTVKGRRYCASCKVMALSGQAPVFAQVTEECAEAGEALKYAIIGIFCLGIILENRACEPVKHAVVGTHDRFEGALVSRADALRELDVMGRPAARHLRIHSLALSRLFLSIR